MSMRETRKLHMPYEPYVPGGPCYTASVALEASLGNPVYTCAGIGHTLLLARVPCSGYLYSRYVLLYRVMP